MMQNNICAISQNGYFPKTGFQIIPPLTPTIQSGLSLKAAVIIRGLQQMRKPTQKIDINKRRKILGTILGNDIPTPFKGAAEECWGIGRQHFPDLTPEKAQKIIREIRGK